MTEHQAKRTRWGAILSGVPKSSPPDGNVVQMPRPTLDELERQLIDANNSVIDAGIECDRAAMVYNERTKALEAARARMAERLKDCDALVQFVRQYPEIET